MRILFQGDSITDAGRDRSDPHHLGHGYVHFTAELLKAELPDADMEFLDLGCSGDRSWEVRERWESDCLEWQPDVLSLMIGVNDTWRAMDQNRFTSAAAYEENVRWMLTQVREKTKAKILVLSPYLLHQDGDKLSWREDFDPKVAACRRVAAELADVFIPTDDLLKEACRTQDPRWFSDDGVHPNENGARWIARLCADALKPWITHA